MTEFSVLPVNDMIDILHFYKIQPVRKSTMSSVCYVRRSASITGAYSLSSTN